MTDEVDSECENASSNELASESSSPRDTWSLLLISFCGDKMRGNATGVYQSLDGTSEILSSSMGWHPSRLYGLLNLGRACKGGAGWFGDSADKS